MKDLLPALRLGKIKSFLSKTLTKSVAVEVEADESEVNAKDSELWSHAPLLYAPAAPSATDAVTGTEHCEAAFMQLGDERVVIATKDRRWQIEVGEGEVILRAMGSGSPAYVHLKPDGSAIIKASTINIGGSATQFVALANLVAAEFAKVWKAIESHIHAGVTVGAGTTAPPSTVAAPTVVAGWFSTGTAVTTAGSVAATKTKAE